MDILSYVMAKNKANDAIAAAIAALPTGVHLLGEVNYYADLPANPEDGDAYIVKYAGTTGEVPDGREFIWLTINNVGRWEAFGPDMSRYQETLVSGTNIKSINGESVLGSGDMRIATNQAFPQTWPTTGTTKAFCDAVNADSTAVEGMSFLGEVTWSDFPTGIANAEVVVQIMDGTGTSNKVIHLILTSGNVAPYRWEYTYWNNGTNVSGWIAFLSQSAADNRYLQLTGGTMSGDIKMGQSNKVITAQGDQLLANKNNYDAQVGNIGHRTYILSNGNDLIHTKGYADYQILDASNTSANPTLAGTEAALTALKLNGTSYKIDVGMSNPMTTAGDIIYSSDNSGTPARLAKGTTGDLLRVGTTGPEYSNALPYLTTAPVSANTNGGIIKVYLPATDEATTTKYSGYEYNFYEVVSP